MHLLLITFLLAVASPRAMPPPHPCATSIMLMSGFDGYYAVYWNGHLCGHGRFVSDKSLGAARLTSEPADEYYTSLCLGSVREHNELLMRDRTGKTVLRRSFRKKQVLALILIYNNYGNGIFVTTRNGPMELE